MASLYRPKVATYCLKDGSYRTPDGKRVTKHTKGAVRKVSTSKKWYGRYTDANGKQHRLPLSESKDTSRRLLTKLAGDAQLAGVGLVDKYAEHQGRSLSEHLGDFRRALLAKNNTAAYCETCHAKAKAILEGCGFTRLDDLEAPPVAEFLAGLREPRPTPDLDPRKQWYTVAEVAALAGIHANSFHHTVIYGHVPGPPPDQQPGKPRRLHADSVRALLERRLRGMAISTSNGYLAAVKRFTKWLVKNQRLPVDPLAHLERLNADVDVRRTQRALREDVFSRFVETTGAGPKLWGLTGPDRLVIYTLAANTGLRAKELRNLTPGSFNLTVNPPTVTVEAGYSKHRRKDVQPLRPDVAEMMRQYMAGKAKNGKVWPSNWYRYGAMIVRRDLAAAGIPFEDDGGRVFDFHAMRGQFISILAARGVHPKVAQILARHSTITLTMDYYTHLDVLDVAGALDKLSELPGAKANGQPGQGAGKAPPAKKRKGA